MFTKTFHYRIKEKDYARWLELSRASNALYKTYDTVSFQQTPVKRFGVVEVEEIVIYPSKEESKRIEAELTAREDVKQMAQTFHAIVVGKIEEQSR